MKPTDRLQDVVRLENSVVALRGPRWMPHVLPSWVLPLYENLLAYARETDDLGWNRIVSARREAYYFKSEWVKARKDFENFMVLFEDAGEARQEARVKRLRADFESSLTRIPVPLRLDLDTNTFSYPTS